MKTPTKYLTHIGPGHFQNSQQKNGRMGETITHETVVDIEHGLVQAVAWLVNAILKNGGNKEKLLSNYVSTEGIWISVRDAIRNLDF